mmetsp:Transcript_15219/g.22422  ORF Transcript_15219/g.22422 Transcript_15219/m.22422 type:complete len:227 (-) Transcript_15219:1168-1848(-)
MNRELDVLVDDLHHVTAVTELPALAVVRVLLVVEVRTVELNVQVIVLVGLQREGHKSVLDGRVGLDNVAALAHHIQVVDLGVVANAIRAGANVENERSVLEGTSRLVRVERNGEVARVVVLEHLHVRAVVARELTSFQVAVASRRSRHSAGHSLCSNICVISVVVVSIIGLLGAVVHAAEHLVGHDTSLRVKGKAVHGAVIAGGDVVADAHDALHVSGRLGNGPGV